MLSLSLHTVIVKNKFWSFLALYGTEEFGVMKNCRFCTGMTKIRLLVSELVCK